MCIITDRAMASPCPPFIEGCAAAGCLRLTPPQVLYILLETIRV